jgi:hypothetical protein
MHTAGTYFVGIILVSISGKIQRKRVGEGLIDDTGIIASSKSSLKITTTRNKTFSPDDDALSTTIQKIIQFFLGLLQIAGGDLNITKCACFTTFHRWNGGCAALLKIQDFHPSMIVAHPYSGEIKTIIKKDTHQAHRALGLMMTTDGKSRAQFKIIKHKVRLFTGAILQSRMQRYDAKTAYNFYYLASIGYTIAATRFSINQCKTIQKPVICATLNKMSINRNVSCTIIFGPKRLGDMSLSHLHTLQGIRRIIGHLANNDGMCKLVRIYI